MASKRAHGLAARYDHGPDENDQPGKGCRCTRCSKAKHTRQEWYRLEKLRGRSRMVDAEPARRHVLALRDQGVALLAIARTAGLSNQVIDCMLHGIPSKGLPPTRTIRRATAEALLAVTPDNVPSHLVSVIGTQRRLQGLAVVGWPLRLVSSYSGVGEDLLFRITKADPETKVRIRTAERVRAASRVLVTRDPLASGVPQGIVTRLRNASKAKDWVPLAAWDDIDDPDALPDLGGDTARSAALVEDAGELLFKHGCTMEETAQRLGVGVNYLYDVRAQARRQLEAVDA